MISCIEITLTICLLFVQCSLTIPSDHNDNTNNAFSVRYTPQDFLLAVNTWPFIDANTAAGQVLAKGGVALDAVEKACSTCEEEQCDHSVGYGGSPDETGQTTLDAMIMDGNTMSVGAVGGLKYIKNAVGVARAVLERTNHTLLVGEDATNFAEGMGFTRESLVTNFSSNQWYNWLKNNCQPNFRKNVTPDSTKNCGPYHKNNMTSLERNERSIIATKTKNNNNKNINYIIDNLNHDTIGVIAIDSTGKIVAGTTTNGLRFKVPGRVGDSPIMGAGAYADSSVGAAVATGDGDVMMRFLPTFYIVEQMRNGVDPTTACNNAMQRISAKIGKFSGAVLAVNVKGTVGAATIGFNPFTYSLFNFTSNKSELIKVYQKYF